MPKGFLAVLSEPGEVDLDEFQGMSCLQYLKPLALDIRSTVDWYNNEHVPLRLNHIPAFLTGARFQAADDKKPSWISLYDIDSTSIFQDPSYTRLRENRSPRETALIKRLGVLDRRSCEAVLESDVKAEGLSTGLAMGNPTQWVVTHGLDIDQEHPLEGADALTKAWQTIISMGNQVPGLFRSRLFNCIDGLKSGVTISPDPEAQRIPKYFALHGTNFTLLHFMRLNSFPTELEAVSDLKPLINALHVLAEEKYTFKVSEERGWKLYRSYPCIAQGNLS